MPCKFEKGQRVIVKADGRIATVEHFQKLTNGTFAVRVGYRDAAGVRVFSDWFGESELTAAAEDAV